MKILITGSNGFLGKNLKIKLMELKQYQVLEFERTDSLEMLDNLVAQADFIFHFAGVNRSQNPNEFLEVNTDLTHYLCKSILSTGRAIPLIFSSSTQAELDNLYGKSKKQAEEYLLKYKIQSNNPVFIYQLTNVFGKWSRPNYNSVIATFCHNIARDLPITIHDASTPLKLAYIDDVVESFISLLQSDDINTKSTLQIVNHEYKTTVGEVAGIIYGFKHSISSGITYPVGSGLTRTLYATYLSFLPTSKFSYALTKHEDARGTFVEMLKTPDCGQFSFFTAHPGVTRGGHYHHTKTEKFLVLQGTALYRFKNIITNEYYELTVNGKDSVVVETIPGWSHDITNVGDNELIVMLWANEIFNREKPDTIQFGVQQAL